MRSREVTCFGKAVLVFFGSWSLARTVLATEVSTCCFVGLIPMLPPPPPPHEGREAAPFGLVTGGDEVSQVAGPAPAPLKWGGQ